MEQAISRKTGATTTKAAGGRASFSGRGGRAAERNYYAG